MKSERKRTDRSAGPPASEELLIDLFLCILPNLFQHVRVKDMMEVEDDGGGGFKGVV